MQSRNIDNQTMLIINTDNRIQYESVINEMINIFMLYISKNKSDLVQTNNQSRPSLAQRFFSSKQDTDYTKCETKINVSSTIIADLQCMASQGHHEILAQLVLYFNHLFELYKNDQSDFGKTVKYAYEYINSVKQVVPTVYLNKDSEEFKILSQQFINDAQSFKKKAQRFDFGIISKSGNINLLKSACTEPPEFGGEDELIFIQEIVCVENKDLHDKYQQVVNNIPVLMKDELLNLGLKIPVLSEKLDANKNEIYLYHGTSLFSAGKIAATGFNCTQFNSHNSIRGYGLLGRGTYLTDQLPKAGLYALCALCGEYRCSCKSYNGNLISKAAFLCKVALGKPEVIIKKDNKIIHETQFEQGCHSRVAISKKINTESAYESNEFAVMADNAVYPQHVIYYHHIKNLLKLNVWLEQATVLKFDLKQPAAKDITDLIREYNILLISSHTAEQEYLFLVDIQKTLPAFFEKQISLESKTTYELMTFLIDHHIQSLLKNNNEFIKNTNDRHFSKI